MNRQNTAYRFANFFTVGILKKSKEGRAGVFLYIFHILGVPYTFLTEDLSILTHNRSLAPAEIISRSQLRGRQAR